MPLQPARIIPFPPMPHIKVGGGPGYNSVTLNVNGASEKAGFVLWPTKTGNIRKAAWRTGTVSTAGANPLDIRIETVLSTGLPSGTLWGTNTNTPHTIGINDDNLWITSGVFTADAVISSLNTPIALVIQNPATSFSAMQVSSIVGAFVGSAGRPYCLLDAGAGWTIQNLNPVIGLEYSDGSYEYVPGVWPASIATTQNVTNATTPDEIGIRFRIPFRARMRGFWLQSQFSAATADFQMVFYDSSGAETITKTFDADLFRSISYQYTEEFFSSTFTLEPATWYRLAYRPTTATAANVSYWGCASTAIMAAMPGGADCYWTERTDAGTWTDLNTRWPVMGVLLDQLSDDAAGAGSVIMPRRYVA